MQKLNPKLEELKALLAELVAVPAPSSFEEPMMRVCKERFSKFTDSVEVDLRGNVYAYFKGSSKSSLKLMLAAHMDAAGLIVKYVEESGFLRFKRCCAELAMCSRRVLIHGSKGPVLGVTGIRVGYGISTKEQLTTVPEEKDMYIDIGCGSREEVEKAGISIGDPVTFNEPLSSLGNPHYVASHALDDRAGVAALITLAANLKNIKPRPEVVLVGTIEEEMGLRGASTAAEYLKPDIGISVDTQPAGGTPEIKPYELPLEIGKGPVIKVTENARVTNHPRVRNLLVEAAKKAKVNYQLAAAPPGGSDMGAMEQACAGIPAAAIGIPRRYAHSPNEVIDLRDLYGVIEILKGGIDILGRGYSLKRI